MAMKKYIMHILIAILLILQFISINRIKNLQNDLRNANIQLSNAISQQSSQIDGIYNNIDSMLKRQSSIIDSYEYSFGEVDRDNLTIPVTFNIVPKEIKEDTVATLHISDKSAVMSRNGPTFTATLPVYIFDQLNAMVVLADSGVEKTEKLEMWENLREKVLPVVNVMFKDSGGAHYSKIAGKLSGEFKKKGRISLEVKSVPNNNIEKARLIIDIDGKVVSEKPINTGGIWCDIDEKIVLSTGQELIMAVEATDSFGLIHKSIIYKFSLDEQANPIHGDEWAWLNNDIIIMDKNGKVLYAPHYEEVY